MSQQSRFTRLFGSSQHQFPDIDPHESTEALVARIEALLRKAREPEAGR
jgi:hypothetical protein